LYEIKSNSEGAIKTISKFLLNSLLGRFGLILMKKTSKFLKDTDYLKIIRTHEIYDEK
jgi:hypothetical protein